MPDCTDINNFLQTEVNRISRDTSEKNSVRTVWETNEIVPKTTWENGMGEAPNFIIYDRSMPLNSLVTFQEVEFNDGGEGDGGGSCAPTSFTVVQATRRLRMRLKKAAIESQKLCVEDGRLSWNVAQQAQYILRNLQLNTRHVWQNARRDEFTSMCTNKVIMDASGTTKAATFGTGTIGQITREFLTHWYYKLVNDGAAEDNGLATAENGQPVLPLILSMEAQETLINNDQTLNNIRWSNSADRLLGPPGSFINLNGFRHKIDMQAARWNLVNGSWVRVPFYLPASIPGEAAGVNPAYYTAEYEDLVIGSNKVVKFAIPSANLSAGPLSFGAQEYMGNYEWLNIRDNSCNKDGNIGYFRGVFGYGAQPVIPEYGAVIRFRRCPTSWIVDSSCS